MVRPVAALLALLSSAALAAPRQVTVVVVDAPSPLRQALDRLLPPTFSVVPAASPLGEAPTTGQVRRATLPARAAAAVLLTVSGKAAQVTVLDGADGTILERLTLPVVRKKGKDTFKPSRADNAALLAALRRGRVPVEAATAPASLTAPPPAAAATPAPRPAEPPVVPSTSAPVASAPSAAQEPSAPLPATSGPSSRPSFGLRVGWLGFNRQLVFSNVAAQSQLSDFRAGFASSVVVEGEWFPGRPFTSGVLGNLGLTGQAVVVVGLSAVNTLTQERYATRSERLRLSATLRLPVSLLEVRVELGVLWHGFAVGPLSVNGVAKLAVPDVGYLGPRAGLVLRLGRLGPFTFEAGGAFSYALGRGELGGDTYFPQAMVFGVDATAGVLVDLAPGLQTRLAFDFVRYFGTLNPAADAVVVATSSADQHLGALVTVGVSL